MAEFNVRKKLFEDDPDIRTLDTLTDDEISMIIDRLCMGFLMVNYREIITVEASYNPIPDQGSLYIKITTITEDGWEDEKAQESQVYGLQFALTYDEELLYTPMNKAVSNEEWLLENGITHDISAHWLDIKKFYELFSNGFKIWSTKGIVPVNPATAIYPEWREVTSEIIATINAY
jgi:hypothetical protein